MQDILITLMQFFTDNAAAAAGAIAAALAGALAFALKALFAWAASLAGKTSTDIDDKIVAATKDDFKQKAQDL